MLNPAIFSSLVSLSGNDWDYFKYHRHVGIGMCSYLEDKEVDVGVGSPNFEADSRGKGESWGVLGPGVNYFLA